MTARTLATRKGGRRRRPAGPRRPPLSFTNILAVMVCVDDLAAKGGQGAAKEVGRQSPTPARRQRGVDLSGATGATARPDFDVTVCCKAAYEKPSENDRLHFGCS